MVSVAFAIWLSLTPERPAGPCGHRFAQATPGKLPIVYASRILCSKRRASLQGYLTPRWLRYCIATRAGADPDDVYDVSSLPEPHGPDGAMAVRSRIGAEIPQPGSARRLRQIVRTARRGARVGLAHLAYLYPPGLRHRQGAGGEPGTGSDRGSRLRDPVRLIAAFQEGEFTGAAAHAAGGADVRSLRDAAARYRQNPAAGSRRLHYRLAQSARHSARRRKVRPRRIYRAPDRLSRSPGPARAYGGDLPAVGVGAGRRRHHVGG